MKMVPYPNWLKNRRRKPASPESRLRQDIRAALKKRRNTLITPWRVEGLIREHKITKVTTEVIAKVEEIIGTESMILHHKKSGSTEEAQILQGQLITLRKELGEIAKRPESKT